MSVADNNKRTFKPIRWSGTEVIITALIAGVAGGYAGYTKGYFDGRNYNKTPITAEGFPKGYHIESVHIPTRGNIIRVEKLPEEHYQKTVDKKTGMITFKGNFEYEIEPLRSAMPKDADHSDMKGNTPYGPNGAKYWQKIKEGTVTLHLDKDTLEGKLKK
jgi:hypothetical protein